MMPSTSPRITDDASYLTYMGVYERLVKNVFRNPEQWPHFIIAVNDHGAWNKDYFGTFHVGIGSITFGIVADPWDRNP